MGDNVFFDLIREDAIEKGRVEGIEKGRAEGARRAVLRVLGRRFGGTPEDLRAHLETVEALEHLERLVDEAAVCADLEAFRKAIDPA